jgi:hypothetical protein
MRATCASVPNTPVPPPPRRVVAAGFVAAERPAGLFAAAGFAAEVGVAI